MKNIIKNITVCTLLAIMSIASVYAQTEAFNYQGIAVDNNGQVLENVTIGLKFSVLNNGNVVMSESHTTTTTGIGHFAVDVGFGTAIVSDFESISWASGAHSLMIEMDITGGTNYTFNTVIELLSVPYALVAEEAGGNVAIGLMGPQGEDGDNGPPGANGLNGLNGLNGDSLPGIAGAPGAPGLQGPKGDDGPQGIPGLGGGIEGPPGDPGDKGPPGNMNGADGEPGPDGDEGEMGPMGDKGPKGDTGQPGPPSNEVGEMGLMGLQGEPGGQPGAPGIPGMNGANGQNGANGIDGEEGNPFSHVVEMTNVVPTPSATHNIYFDDGFNRADGNPGLRFYNGSFWIDL